MEHQWYDFIVHEAVKHSGSYAEYNDTEAERYTYYVEPNKGLQDQIEPMYRGLPEAKQREIIESAEAKRKIVGTEMNRTSLMYASHVAAHVLTTVKADSKLLKKYVLNGTIYPYDINNPSERFHVERHLGNPDSQNVFKTKEDFIIKWNSTQRDLEGEDRETEVYARLKSMGAQVPVFKTGYHLLDFCLLVLEFLQPVDENDDVIEMAHQLLTTQLKYLHVFGCHFDIKPDNIRKRNGKYFLIDMDIATSHIPNGGYVRSVRTPLWSSQPVPRMYPVTGYAEYSNYKNDFIELMYVIHHFIVLRAYKAKKSLFERGNRYYRPTWEDPFGLKLENNDFFADVETMNKDPISKTARGWLAMRSLLEWPLDQQTIDITWDYKEYVESLPNHPPDHVHETLAETLQKSPYYKFLNATPIHPDELQCRICSSISAYVCGSCYHETSYICSDACAREHVCQ